LLVGAVYNKFIAKKDWKKLGIVALIGVIIPVAIIFLVPSSLLTSVLAGVFLLGAFVVFFKNLGKW
jgi:VIT1/CCC1 family predicted Fe2+/Mn2+ transporter